jgi:tRNA(fMet)-specific endonuclease VapC
LDEILILEINESLADAYAEIDAFSQRRNPLYAEYSFSTPRNMGKNDLWIASTAALLGLKLVTTDADFNHLHQVFVDVQLVKPEVFAK